MEKTNYAAIDIGSNAVRLLIKSVELQYMILRKSNKGLNEKKS